MNDETFSPDKIADVHETIDKIHCIFNEYKFLPDEGAAILLTMLELVGERKIEEGAELDIICDSFGYFFEQLITHLRTFQEESLHE